MSWFFSNEQGLVVLFTSQHYITYVGASWNRMVCVAPKSRYFWDNSLNVSKTIYFTTVNYKWTPQHLPKIPVLSDAIFATGLKAEGVTNLNKVPVVLKLVQGWRVQVTGFRSMPHLDIITCYRGINFQS